MNLRKAYKILEENKQTYNEVANEFNETRNKHDSLMDELKKYVKNNEKVLDLGCGSGRLCKLFNNQDIDYTGVDFSENLIDIAKEKHGDYFKVANILNLPFLDEKFDSVWSIAALHHIPSNKLRKRVLSEIKRVLVPNGRVIVTCWRINHFYVKMFLFRFMAIRDTTIYFQKGK
jgi:ubiquinone/menaquinone biosynthesis C-methylase UbiE